MLAHRDRSSIRPHDRPLRPPVRRRPRHRGSAERPGRHREDRRRRVGRQHRSLEVRVARRRMSTMNRYSAITPLPERISRLGELAVDLWWSWNADARAVFRRLDYPLWRATAHNPVRMLWTIAPEKLAAAAADPDFVARYDRAMQALDAARGAHNTWFTRTFPEHSGRSIAYFSAE